MSELYQFDVKNNDGTECHLSQFKGEVLLIVNTASECGFTSQYDGLQALHEQFHERGFSVLAFPCNQFGGQEPGTDDAIASFCTTRFSLSFPLFSKVDVNGANASPLFNYLKKEAKGLLGSEAIKWNFTKFLVDRDGQVIDRFASATAPEKLAEKIERLL